MARTSNHLKAQYTKLDQDSEVCYFCGALSSLEDLTPSSSITDVERDLFNGQWVRVNACRKHWGQVYTANIVNAGQAFGTRKGLMTLEQKQALVGGTNASVPGAIVLGFEKKWLVPTGTTMLGTSYFMDNVKFDESEIEALQPAFGMKYLDRPAKHVRMALIGAIANGLLDVDDMTKYEIVLGIA